MKRKWSIWDAVLLLVAVGLFYFWVIESPQSWKHKDNDIRAAEKQEALVNIHWYNNWSRYATIVIPGFVMIIVGWIAFTKGRATQKKAAVHQYEINNSKIVVHEKDLSVAAPLAMGLMTAEQLRQINAGSEQAVNLYTKMADTQTRQIQAILKGTGVAKTFTHALPTAAEQPLALAAPGALSFQQLLQQGALAPGKPLIVGFHQGQPEYRSLENLKSVAVAGWQGSGKTSSAAYLLASSILAYDVHTYVIDPHKHHNEGLYAIIQPLEQTGRLTVMNPFDTPGLIRTLTQRLERRLRGEESSARGILLVVDELARLAKMDCFDDLIILLERCTEETRKANITFLGISTKWTARHFKGRADIRACMNSALVHKCKPSQAELLLEDAQDKKLLEQLQKPGDAILVTDYAGAKPVSIPYCTQQDMETVARQICAQITPLILPANPMPTSDNQAESVQTPFAPAQELSAPTAPPAESILTPELLNAHLKPAGAWSQREIARRTGVTQSKISFFSRGAPDALNPDEKQVIFDLILTNTPEKSTDPEPAESISQEPALLDN